MRAKQERTRMRETMTNCSNTNQQPRQQQCCGVPIAIDQDKHNPAMLQCPKVKI